MVSNTLTRDQLVGTLTWLFDTYMPEGCETFQSALRNVEQGIDLGDFVSENFYECFGVQGVEVRASLPMLLLQLANFSLTPHRFAGNAARKLVPILVGELVNEERYLFEAQMYADYRFAREYLVTLGVQEPANRHLRWLLEYAAFHAPHPRSLSKQQLAEVDAAIRLDDERERQIIVAGCVENIQVPEAYLMYYLSSWLQVRNYPAERSVEAIFDIMNVISA